MIDLAQHIEKLLLENDCVIVPNLGGFVAHYNPAMWVEEEHTFLPPTRIIGFNPQLKMNDGLLVQSFMSVYGTNFSDATRIVDKKVEKLTACLHGEGKAVLPNIGEIRCTIHGAYDFVPYDNRVTTPSLYGLDSFQIMPLAELRKAGNQKKAPLRTMPAATLPRQSRTRRTIRWRRSYLSNAVAIIAAVIAFFLLSTPIENTEVIQGNYAQLLPGELFEQIGKNSLAIHPISVAEPIQTPKTKNVKAQRSHVAADVKRKSEVKPVAVREVKVKELESVALAEKAQATPQPTRTAIKEVSKPYHIIVASVGTEKDAQAMADMLKQKGYAGAEAIIGNGKMRVSIESFATQAEAYQSLQTVRQTKEYESAWVLKD